MLGNTSCFWVYKTQGEDGQLIFNSSHQKMTVEILHRTILCIYLKKKPPNKPSNTTMFHFCSAEFACFFCFIGEERTFSPILHYLLMLYISDWGTQGNALLCFTKLIWAWCCVPPCPIQGNLLLQHTPKSSVLLYLLGLLSRKCFAIYCCIVSKYCGNLSHFELLCLLFLLISLSFSFCLCLPDKLVQRKHCSLSQHISWIYIVTHSSPSLLMQLNLSLLYLLFTIRVAEREFKVWTTTAGRAAHLGVYMTMCVCGGLCDWVVKVSVNFQTPIH